MGRTYQIKECFYTLQGEGVRTGEPSLFLRFAGCNLNCTKEEVGFNCDTDWKGGTRMDLAAIVEMVLERAGKCRWIVFTGGEPSLQLDEALIVALKAEGFHLAVESNGTNELPPGLDWICVCPKRPDEQIKQRFANELKVVLRHGMEIPKYGVKADNYVISPAFEVTSKTDPTDAGYCEPETLKWCIRKCLENPPWRLSVQDHKAWRLR